MSEKVANIAKNTSYFTLALILQKIISLAYFTIYARELGPDILGRYYSAISFTTIFSIFIDLGLSNFLTREIAKDKEQTNKLLGNILFVKIILSIITLLITFLVANLWGYSGEILKLIYISSISMVLDSFTLTFFSCSRGFHNLKYESISSVIFQAIILVTSLFILSINKNIYLLMFSLAFASLFNFVYSAFVNIYKWKIKIRPFKDWNLIKHIFSLSLPFGIYAIFQRIYTYVDSLLLFKFLGERGVGVYQIPFKIINALQFLPMAFTASLYPAMSAYWKNNREQLGVTFERAINYSVIISLPITVGTLFLSDKIMVMFQSGHDYSDAIWPLRIIILSVFFMFVSYPVGSLLNACDRQKENTINMIIVTVFSFGLNLLLIPALGVNGASLTVLLSNILMLVLGWRFINKIIVYRSKNIFLPFLKSLLAALLMGLITFLLKKYLNIFIVVLISSFVYLGGLFVFGAIKKDDVTSIVRSFKLRK